MSDIRKGFVTQTEMELEESIERAGQMGFDFLEIMMDGENHRENLEADSNDILRLADEKGVSLTVHLPFSVDIGSPHEHVRHGSIEEIRACIETAAGLGAEKAVLHASSEAWSAVWDREEVQDLVMESIRQLDGSAVDHGVEVCVENVPGEFFGIRDFDRLFDGTEAAMCLDTGHARVEGMDGEGLGAFVEEWRDRISHVHVNDTRQETDDHVPFGSGNFDFEPVFEPLRGDWEGTLALEVFTPSWDYIQFSKEKLDEMI